MYIQWKFNFFNSQDILPKFGVVINFSINYMNIMENYKKIEKIYRGTLIYYVYTVKI